MPTSVSMTRNSLHRVEADLDSAVIAAVIDTMNTVIQERTASLKTGRSLREINATFIHEYSLYVASLTGQDVATVHHTIATSLARSGKEASATLLQLVVGARVYQTLGITPTVGVLTLGGSS